MKRAAIRPSIPERSEDPRVDVSLTVNGQPVKRTNTQGRPARVLDHVVGHSLLDPRRRLREADARSVQ